jgi:hypothetical protein
MRRNNAQRDGGSKSGVFPTEFAVSATVERTTVPPDLGAYKQHVASDKDTDLTPAERAVIKAAINRAGEPFVLKILGLSRQTLARVVAGLPVRRGTVVMVRQGMKERPQDFETGGSKDGAGPATVAGGAIGGGASVGKGARR